MNGKTVMVRKIAGSKKSGHIEITDLSIEQFDKYIGKKNEPKKLKAIARRLFVELKELKENGETEKGTKGSGEEDSEL